MYGCEIMKPMAMPRTICLLVTVFLLCTFTLKGQVGTSLNQDPFTSQGGRNMGGMGGGPAMMVPSNLNGFGIFSVSAFGGYSTYPLFNPATSRFGSVGSSLTGGMVSVGYGRVLGERSRFAILYAPGIIVRPSDLGRSRANHLLSLNFTQGLTPRLSMGVSIFATYAELDQFAFSPARFSLVTAAPGSFDDLANAIAGGQYSNSQIASLLTGTPVLESAARSSIYGNQTLTANAQFRLSYQAAPRLTIGLYGGGNRYQSVGIKGDDLDRRALIPITNGLTSGVNISYGFSRQTSVGGNVGVTKTDSRITQATYVTYTGNISHRFGQKAALSLQGGSGSSFQTNQQFISGPARRGQRYLAGATLGVQATTSQMFMLQVNRTFVDNFGLGLHRTVSAIASWSYAPTGSQWTGTFSGGYQEATTGLLAEGGKLKGTFIGLGINRKLGMHWGIGTQAYYSWTNNTLGASVTGANSQGTFERVGARLVITWYPKPLEY
jgi:hypothetical protein